MKDSQLTEKQRRWLEESRKIGPGAMTKTERERLERLYAEMLPAEQQELQLYIKETFGKTEDHKSESTQSSPEPQAAENAEAPQTDDSIDPIVRMEKKEWSLPSDAFRKTFATVKPRKRDK